MENACNGSGFMQELFLHGTKGNAVKFAYKIWRFCSDLPCGDPVPEDFSNKMLKAAGVFVQMYKDNAGAGITGLLQKINIFGREGE